MRIADNAEFWKKKRWCDSLIVNSFSLGQNAFSNEKDAFYTNAQNPDLSVCESGFPVVDHACIGGFSLLHSLARHSLDPN